MPEIAELKGEFQKSIAFCTYVCLLVVPVCIPLFTVLLLTQASLPPEAKEAAEKIGTMISAMYRVVPFTMIPAIVCGVLAFRLKKAGGELNLDHSKYIAVSIVLIIPSFFIPVLVLWPVKRAFHGMIRAYSSQPSAGAGIGVHSAASGLSLLWFALLLTLFRAALPPL